MLFRYPINDVHIHLFDPKDIDDCVKMVEFCGYEHWAFMACTVIGMPLALCQNLLCALMKLREGGRCQAFGSFHYYGNKVPDDEELLRQIKWLQEAGFDGIKMLDGKPGIRVRNGIPLDAPNYDKMFSYAEQTQFPILYHINDPVEFWHYDQLPQWAVEKNFFYGTDEFPHKFEIDEETLRMLRKHPDLKLCIPHFFFISDQPGLCSELFDRYPNFYLDITPGWEMFENFAKDREFWRNFFGEHSNRILFGTDTFSDHWMQTVTCLQRVMETDEHFVAFEENCIGLDLPEKTLRDVYYNNYFDFVGTVDRKINVPMVLEYADTLYEHIPQNENYEYVKNTIDYLKSEIAKFA